MNDANQLKKLRRLYKEAIRKNDAYRKTDGFKKLTEDEKHTEDTIYWQTEAGPLEADIGELETKIFLKQLNRYGIPAPSRHDEKTQDKYWTNNSYGEYRELSQEGYYELNGKLREEKKARREERFFWIPLISVATTFIAIISVFFTISSYQLNENATVAELGVNFDNAKNLLIFKNYGKLAGAQFNLIGKQIEFAEKPNELNIFKVGADYIYPNEDMVFPPKILIGNSQKHAQFLLLVWRYHDGKKLATKSRIWVRTPSEPYWVPTIRPLVDINQWRDLMVRITEMEKALPPPSKSKN